MSVSLGNNARSTQELYMIKRGLAASLSALLSLSAAGAAMACPMSYEAFELAIPHLDLRVCPTPIAREGVFCRASVANDAVHVFVFSKEGDRCLLGVNSLDESKYLLTLR
jgi:hypothetical protein